MDKLNDLFTKIITKLNKKVDSEEGKGLSSNDFTTEEKTKLEGIASGAQVNTIESISVNGTKVEPDEQKNVEIKAYTEDNKPEVGGRNYILGSADHVIDNLNSAPESRKEFGMFNLGKSYMDIPGGSTISVSFDMIMQINDDSGDYPYIRVYNTYEPVRSPKYFPDQIIKVDGHKGDTVRQRIHFTTTLLERAPEETDLDYNRIEFYSGYGSSNWFKISNLKLELGEIATDWTPAPEDKQNKIDMIGARNLILNSDTPITNSNYLLNTYTMTASDLKDGDKVTVSLKGILGEGKTQFGIYNSNGNTLLGVATPDENGYATMTAEWRTTQHNNAIQVYTRPSSVSNVDSTIEWIKLERGEIPTDWTPAPEDLAPIDEQKILAQIANRTYQGTDLTVKFKSEIDGSFSGNPWAWIQSRINNANWDGIHICDYIPFTTTNSVTMQAQIAGIDTYYRYSDQLIPHHIDFITREVWPTLHSFNPVGYNNGTATQNYPWLASDMYLWLNSKAGTVPNATTVNPETTEVDYTTDGVYYFLPEELKEVIIEKRFLLETRYNASSLLTTSPGWGWQNEGKLWLPTEMEVYGTNIWGGASYPTGSSIQYPIFANSMNRLKYRNGSRCSWWLSTPYLGTSTAWCNVDAYGYAHGNATTNTGIVAPVCFRIASTVKTADEEYLEDEILEQPLPE